METKKQELTKFGKLLHEININKRPIAIIRLEKPIYHNNWCIGIIEIAAPKPEVETKQALEHVEFVLFDSIEDFLKKHPNKQFDLKAIDRGVNPEIKFKLPSYSVKFHLLSIAAVVYLERKLKIDNI